MTDLPTSRSDRGAAPGAPDSSADGVRGAGGRIRAAVAGLRLRLFLLVLLAILPALFLAIYTALEHRKTAKQEAKRFGQRLVSLAAANQKQHIEATRQFLITLAQLKEVRPERAAECRALFASLLQAHPVFANIVAIAPDGSVFASALTNHQAATFDNPALVKQVLDTQKFAVGDYRVEPGSKKATVDLAQPVMDPESGRLVAVVSASFDLGWLAAMAARADLADGSTLTVVSRNGIVLIRYSVPESDLNYVGTRVGKEHQISAAVLSKGVDYDWVGEGLDGIRRLYTSTPLSRSGGLADGHVILGIPLEAAFAEANRMLAQNLMFLGVVAALALGAAWIGGDFFILRHLRSVVMAARRMVQGDLTARSGVAHGPGEVGQLARSFDEMAAALEGRLKELQLTEAELKALNEELEQRVLDRTIELKRSNEDLEQFAYVASHDLQEPLRMIHNYLQLLRQRYHDRLDASAQDFIGFSLDGARRMHELIKDLLTYSRVGTHGKEMVPTECQAAFEDALANLALAIEESQAIITHDPLPAITGDAVQLTQLFQNLIGNAIKFRGENPPRIHVGVQRKGAEWELTVSDNGIGIAEQDFQRIFVVFQRLHSREKYPGTGIGLAVCKKIVERHGGRIWVESKLGRGTTFHIVLPARAGDVTGIPRAELPLTTETPAALPEVPDLARTT